MEKHVVEYGQYMPHGMCLLWEPWLVLLWAGSDLLIFMSYIAIPVALFMVLRQRTDVPQSALVGLFAAFILLCGFTHFFMIVTLWIPIYPFVSWVKLATGLVSTATAFMLFRLIPELINLPSPNALELVNRGLQAEIAAHKETLASLDQQVRERTAELEDATKALAVQAREAVHRSSNLLAVVQTLALQSAKGTKSMDAFLSAFLGRVRALATATRAIAQDDQSSAQLGKLIEAALAMLKDTYGKRISSSGPALSINPTAAQQFSLALHELGTNTHKYGLGASEAARVSVTWTIRAGVFELVWREDNGAVPDPATPPSDGFGTKLLTSIIPATLDGTAERQFERGALIYRLVVPIATIKERAAGGSDPSLAARIIETNYKN